MALLKPQNYMSGGIAASGEWAIGFPPFEAIKCYAVVAGACSLSVDGVADPVHLKTGDCFLLPLARAFRLASDLALPAVDFKALVSEPLMGSVLTLNGGGDFFGVGGIFVLSGDHANVLLGMLPPIVHIKQDADRADMRWSIERMMHELREPRPGGTLVAQHLASLLLVQALRLHLADAPRGGTGWLFALADEEMSTAIGLMHANPAHRWTLSELASRLAMSRSSFASKFKTIVGVSPMDYLTRWRMLLACDRLTNTDDSISTIAASLGYESESAFSAAFKRIIDCSPRQYARPERFALHCNIAPEEIAKRFATTRIGKFPAPYSRRQNAP